jgi:hypothetical protein
MLDHRPCLEGGVAPALGWHLLARPSSVAREMSPHGQQDYCSEWSSEGLRGGDGAGVVGAEALVQRRLQGLSLAVKGFSESHRGCLTVPPLLRPACLL